MLKLFVFSSLLFYLHLISFAYSAACCGSGFVAPSVITTEDKAQFALSFYQSKIHADVNTKSQWNRNSSNDRTKTYKFEAAHLISDRWQIGGSLPIISRKNNSNIDNHSSGTGDLSLQIGYEYLPDWDYNPIRPKGIGYLGIIVPTGKSIYDSDTVTGVDARGKGFWGTGLGTVLIKRWYEWDATCALDFYYYFKKNISSTNSEAKVAPGYTHSQTLGGGWSFNELRLGALASFSYEDNTKISGTTNSESSLKRSATATFLVSYFLPHQQSIVVSYSDQTLLGDPYNTSLSKTFGIFYQMKFER